MSFGDFPDSCLLCGRYPADSHPTIARHLLVSCANAVKSMLVGQNVRVRKLLIGVLATATAMVVIAVGTDFGAAIYAEYRLARSVRNAANLRWDPSVAILGFPFIPQAADRRYDEIEIRANGVEHPVVGQVALEATLHDIDLADASWLVGPDAKLPVGKAESRIRIDSTHVGRFMGIPDLLVEAPTRESNDATGGTTESGISSNRGLVFTGTPKKAGYDEKVSIAVDLSIAGADHTTLVLTAAGVLTGPGTADQPVPEDKKDAVLAAFSAHLPGQKLPFGLTPTAEGARGSDIIIEGIAEGVTISLAEFNLS
jgi:LmeA-like phospholipid-binding